MELKFFSVGCTVKILGKASEYAVGGEELEYHSITNDMRGRTYIIAWVGRFVLRVRYKGVDMYFEKSDVTVTDNI